MKVDVKARVGNPAGETGRWRGEPPRALPAGPAEDPGHPVFEPVLDRVSPWHVRVYGQRRLEPEVMDGGDEAEAYMGAAAQAHLARLDAAWVERVVAYGPRGAAAVLDVGTGGGQIPARIARRRPDWRIWGVDRAGPMLAAGHAGIVAARCEAAVAIEPFRLGLARAEARGLPFADGAFDLVISNSLLHHLGDPTPVLDEIARVTAATGRVLIRDLRRPPRLLHRAWVGRHGRHYSGAMRRLYEDSVAAAFTPDELAIVLRHSGLAPALVRSDGPYLLAERSPSRRTAAAAPTLRRSSHDRASILPQNSGSEPPTPPPGSHS